MRPKNKHARRGLRLQGRSAAAFFCADGAENELFFALYVIFSR